MRNEGSSHYHIQLTHQVNALSVYLEAHTRALTLDMSSIQKILSGDDSAVIAIDNHKQRGLPQYILHGESAAFFDCTGNLQITLNNLSIQIMKNAIKQCVLNRMLENKIVLKSHFDILMETSGISSNAYTLIRQYARVESNHSENSCGFFSDNKTAAPAGAGTSCGPKQ